MKGAVEHVGPQAADDAACLLWAPAVAAASKGKLLPPADAEAVLREAGHSELDALEKACVALQQWCWVHGLPPLDRAISHPRVKGDLRVAADYDVFFEAMAAVVTGEKFVLAYPWRKVREPSPADLARARHLLAIAQPTLRAFRFLDLEIELRDTDAARGRRRPFPAGCLSWEDAATKRRALLAELAAHGVDVKELRPGGVAPYPPPPPRESSYEH